MTMNPLGPDISVTTQIEPQQLVAAKAAGFRTIINNRPDGEEPGQPSSAALKAAAQRAGLRYVHIPVKPGELSESQADAFAGALNSCDKPVLAFCKSGMRATSLWALSQAGDLSVAEILRRAKSCGYDLAALTERIEARARAHD